MKQPPPYRVVRHTSKARSWLEFHEAHYAGEKLVSLTERGVTLHGHTVADLRSLLHHLQKACDAPPVDYHTLEELPR